MRFRPVPPKGAGFAIQPLKPFHYILSQCGARFFQLANHSIPVRRRGIDNIPHIIDALREPPPPFISPVVSREVWKCTGAPEWFAHCGIAHLTDKRLKAPQSLIFLRTVLHPALRFVSWTCLGPAPAPRGRLSSVRVAVHTTQCRQELKYSHAGCIGTSYAPSLRRRPIPVRSYVLHVA